jgi:predicted RNase H-like HicB family nuclease
MDKEFNIVIEEGEDGYLISEVIGLPGCHTQAKTLDELIKRTKEAVSLYLKCEKRVKLRDRFLGVQKITVGA